MIEPQTTAKTPARNISDLDALTTERLNEASAGLDTKSAIEIARIINHEDAKITAAVKKALPEIAIVIDIVARSLRDGGPMAASSFALHATISGLSFTSGRHTR